MSTAPTVVLSGPQGCGKTRNALLLAHTFGCAAVVDEWAPSQPLRLGALHLFSGELPGGALPPGVVRLSWADVELALRHLVQAGGPEPQPSALEVPSSHWHANERCVVGEPLGAAEA